MSPNVYSNRSYNKEKLADNIVKRDKFKQSNEIINRKNKKIKKFKSKIKSNKECIEENLFYIDKQDGIRKKIKLLLYKNKIKSEPIKYDDNINMPKIVGGGEFINLLDIISNAVIVNPTKDYNLFNNDYKIEKTNSNLLIKNKDLAVLFKLEDSRLKNT